jgi:phosphatidyl-myo-inositol alpha-mannosyltransferase
MHPYPGECSPVSCAVMRTEPTTAPVPHARPLRVGIVSPYSLTVPGGVQAQVLGLARVLRRMGVEARVLGPCDGPPPATYVTPLGNSIPTAANGSVVPLAPDPSCTLRTIRALRDEDFDVLHVHEPLVPGPTMTSLVFDAIPSVGTFHAAGDSAGYKYGTQPLVWLADHLDVRCVVSKDAQQLVQGYLGGEYRMMFNGVELDRYRNPEPFKADGPTIFFCGRHEPRKGLSVLLESLRQLPDEVRCWVASDGPETEELQARFADDRRIEWLGRIPDEEKIARLAGASVFCAPSLHGESFGVVLIEAMAAGTPVVATDLPGYLNVATPDVDALVVPANDAVALADALRRVLYEPALVASLRTAGSVRAEDFSMEALARRYLVIYEELAAGYVRERGPQTRFQRSAWAIWRSRMLRRVGTSARRRLT